MQYSEGAAVTLSVRTILTRRVLLYQLVPQAEQDERPAEADGGGRDGTSGSGSGPFGGRGSPRHPAATPRPRPRRPSYDGATGNLQKRGGAGGRLAELQVRCFFFFFLDSENWSSDGWQEKIREIRSPRMDEMLLHPTNWGYVKLQAGQTDILVYRGSRYHLTC